MKLTIRKSQAVGERAHDLAAEWRLRVEGERMSAADRARLQRWLAEDPEHQLAWDDIDVALASVSQNAAATELLEMRNAALALRAEPRRFSMFQFIAAGVAVVGVVSLWVVHVEFGGRSSPVLAGGETSIARTATSIGINPRWSRIGVFMLFVL